MPEVSWSELHSESDLFTWFSLTESRRRAVGDITWITVAPEALPDSVLVSFGVDAAEHVLGFQLAIDRLWLDGDPTAMANAGDLAKSVVQCFARVDPVLGEVANALQAGSFRASPSPVITRDAVPEPTDRADIAAVVDVLAAASSAQARVEGARVLSAANVRSGDRVWFQLGWGATPEVFSAAR